MARRLAPELLEAVVVARVGGEDVDDHVEVVHEDPARLVEALDAARQHAAVLLHPLVDAVVDRLRLALRVAGADDEEVGVADHVVEVDDDHVDGELVGGQLGDAVGELAALGDGHRAPTCAW